MTRRIRVYNTSGQNNKVIDSSATTWGDLKSDLDAHGISYSGMKVVVGETQNTLESVQAVLPEGEMTLFLMPQKVKSGSEYNFMIDPINGIKFHDVDWTDYDKSVEDYEFISEKDLALAKLAKARVYIESAERYLRNNPNKSSGDPEVDNLTKMAAQIQANINVFE